MGEQSEKRTPDYDAAVAACPTPAYHETHRYCPSCPWTEQGSPIVQRVLAAGSLTPDMLARACWDAEGHRQRGGVPVPWDDLTEPVKQERRRWASRVIAALDLYSDTPPPQAERTNFPPMSSGMA